MKTKLNLFAMFLGAMLLALPDVVNAQFTYTTNNDGSLNISQYTGPGGAVVIPSTTNGLPVTSIGSYAFQNATSLSSITIPSSVTNIGYEAFANCYGLTGVYFQGNAPSLDPYNPYVFNTANVTVYYLPGTSGWSSTFGGRPAVMLNPPNPAGSLQVTLSPAAAITAGMRWQVDGGIAQPSGAIVLGLSVGNHTVSFSPLNGWAMPASQSIAVSANSTATASGTYGQLTYTTNSGAITITKYTGNGGAVLPGTVNGLPVTRVGSQAFQNATSLTSVTIPGSVTNIGNGAFNWLTSLIAIMVDPANLFYSSTNGVLFNKNQTTLIQFPGGAGGSYMIPQSVTNIGSSAFIGCSSLTSVTIPNSVIDIGYAAFFQCMSLTNVTIGTNVTSIENQAFQNCYSLTSVMIPNSVTSIPDYEFYGCSSLTSVTIGTNVTSIGYAFDNCPSLTGIYFQGNAPGLGSAVFDSDNNATVYYLPWTTGWGTPGTLFGGCPTALWLPQAQTSAASFGVLSNQFGFNISWASDMVIVVEACTNLANPAWTPVGTNTLTGGSSYFSDSQWTNYPARFYRLRSP